MFILFLDRKKSCLAFLKTCLLSSANILRILSAYLAFIDVVWHVLSSNIAYLVHLNLEMENFFCGFSVTTFCDRCVWNYCIYSSI